MLTLITALIFCSLGKEINSAPREYIYDVGNLNEKKSLKDRILNWPVSSKAQKENVIQKEQRKQKQNSVSGLYQAGPQNFGYKKKKTQRITEVDENSPFVPRTILKHSRKQNSDKTYMLKENMAEDSMLHDSKHYEDNIRNWQGKKATGNDKKQRTLPMHQYKYVKIGLPSVQGIQRYSESEENYDSLPLHPVSHLQQNSDSKMNEDSYDLASDTDYHPKVYYYINGDWSHISPDRDYEQYPDSERDRHSLSLPLNKDYEQNSNFDTNVDFTDIFPDRDHQRNIYDEIDENSEAILIRRRSKEETNSDNRLQNFTTIQNLNFISITTPYTLTKQEDKKDTLSQQSGTLLPVLNNSTSILNKSMTFVRHTNDSPEISVTLAEGISLKSTALRLRVDEEKRNLSDFEIHVHVKGISLNISSLHGFLDIKLDDDANDDDISNGTVSPERRETKSTLESKHLGRAFTKRPFHRKNRKHMRNRFPKQRKNPGLNKFNTSTELSANP